MRTINADELKANLHKWFPQASLEGIEAKTLFAQILADIDNTPTVDTSERPQGKWIKAYVDKREFWFCKKCLYPLFNEPKTNFCPNCGADMRGGAE